MFCTSTIGRQRFSLAAGVGVLRRGSVHIDDVLVGWMAIAGYVYYARVRSVSTIPTSYIHDVVCVYPGTGRTTKKENSNHSFFFFFFFNGIQKH